jgi:hypothetical protein
MATLRGLANLAHAWQALFPRKRLQPETGGWGTLSLVSIADRAVADAEPDSRGQHGFKDFPNVLWNIADNVFQLRQ